MLMVDLFVFLPFRRRVKADRRDRHRVFRVIEVEAFAHAVDEQRVLALMSVRKTTKNVLLQR